jgi:hypothetical protein
MRMPDSRRLGGSEQTDHGGYFVVGQSCEADPEGIWRYF